MLRPLCVTALALLSTVPAVAQVVFDGGPSSPSGGIVSPFKPTPYTPTLAKGGSIEPDPGPGYEPPGDAAAPGDTGSDSGTASPQGRSARGTSDRVPSGRRAGDLPAAARASSVTSLANLDTDTWQDWWETNKFDFITLRRVEDDPYTGQGLQQESLEDKTLRLARLREVVRNEVVPSLRELTHADDAAVRASSIVALGKLGDLASADLARGLLRDPNFDVRRAAMLSLGVLDAGRAHYLLMNLAADSAVGRTLLDGSRLSDDDRSVALLTSALRGNDSAEQMISDLLDDRDDLSNELLAVACESAGLVGSTRSLDPLSKVARDDDLPGFVRSSAATALGRLGDPSAVPVLLELLDASIEPRRAAAVSLGFVAHGGMDGVISRLAHLLTEESDGPTRHFAAVSLGRLAGPAAENVLASSLAKANSDMRPWLALGLGLCERSLGGGRNVPLLIEQVAHESNVDTRGAYLIALGLTGDPRALEPLSKALAQAPVQVAAQAALALGLSRLPDAQPVLRQALRSSNSPIVQQKAALGLGILGDRSAVPDLLELIRSSRDPYVASSAAIGVAFMGDEDAIGPLLHLIRSEGPRGVATTYAVVAVGQLFDSERRPALARLASGDNYLARSSAVSQLLALGF